LTNKLNDHVAKWPGRSSLTTGLTFERKYYKINKFSGWLIHKTAH